MATVARVTPFSARRQILSPIDLRTRDEREGITSQQRTIQAIVGIVQDLGQLEQKRRERQRLDRVATALAGGATTTEAILAIANQDPEFSEGFGGKFQRATGIFGQPQAGGIRQQLMEAIIGQRRKPELTDLETRQAEAEIRAREALADQRTAAATAKAEVKPFTVKQTVNMKEKIQEIVDSIEARDIKGIGKGQRRNVIFQEDLVEAYKETMVGLELNERQRKQIDRIWDATARKLSPIRQQTDSDGKVIKIGWNPNSPEVKKARRELKAGTVSAKPVPPPQFDAPRDVRAEQFAAFSEAAASIPAPDLAPAPDSIPKPKTQAEFDAIPSGTEFEDTDGTRKIKK